jgi:cyclase
MLCKRIISCLDIKDGRTVKGTQFLALRDAGDPVELAALYAEQGVDELVLLDITATVEKRKALTELVRNVAKAVNIPFTVGGGITSVEDVSSLLKNGADKISLNSAAFRNPELITELAKEFGSQCIVVAIDGREDENGQWNVYLDGGRSKTPRDVFNWAKEAQDLGAGEILFTSMNHDGMKNGFALQMIGKMSNELTIPIIASGGAGTMDHFVDVFNIANAHAALAASIFHFGEIEIPELKEYLQKFQIPTRHL